MGARRCSADWQGKQAKQYLSDHSPMHAVSNATPHPLAHRNTTHSPDTAVDRVGNCTVLCTSTLADLAPAALPHPMRALSEDEGGGGGGGGGAAQTRPPPPPGPPPPPPPSPPCWRGWRKLTLAARTRHPPVWRPPTQRWWRWEWRQRRRVLARRRPSCSSCGGHRAGLGAPPQPPHPRRWTPPHPAWQRTRNPTRPPRRRAPPPGAPPQRSPPRSGPHPPIRCGAVARGRGGVAGRRPCEAEVSGGTHDAVDEAAVAADVPVDAAGAVPSAGVASLQRTGRMGRARRVGNGRGRNSRLRARRGAFPPLAKERPHRLRARCAVRHLLYDSRSRRADSLSDAARMGPSDA
jgi:hypothetical protein